MGSHEDPAALDLLDFWLAAGPDRWFAPLDAFDEACRTHLPLWQRAKEGGCSEWGRTAAGSLALIVLLDQIPRNSFRGSAEQFSTDALALAAARAAVAAGHDRSQPWPVRKFFYMPFQHCEDLAVQDESLDLFRPSGERDLTYYYALVHADAIRRFGRFAHRNAVLGRETTEAEQAYLASGGFGA